MEGVKVLVPSHGECGDGEPYEYIQKYYKYRKDREDLVLGLLKAEAMSVEELVDRIYAKVLSGKSDPRYRAARHNTEEVVKKLAGEGLVKQSGEGRWQGEKE